MRSLTHGVGITKSPRRTPLGHAAAHGRRAPSRVITDSTHAATTIGATARSLLLPGAHGVVLATVTGAVYLIDDDGDLLWISPPDQPAHTRAVLTAASLGRPEPGRPFRVLDGRLIVRETAVDLTDAKVWEPIPTEAVDGAALRDVFHSYRDLVATLALLDHGESLGRLVSLIGEMASRSSPKPDPCEIQETKASAGPLLPLWEKVGMRGLTLEGRLAAGEANTHVMPVLPLLRACARGDRAAVLALAPRVIGLGPGLTPSGDDFLGGLFFAEYHLSAAFPQACLWDEAGLLDMLQRHAQATNRISHAILMDMARGQGPEPLHTLTGALLTDGDHSVIIGHAVRVTRLGHSSGWDLLTGFMAGMTLAWAIQKASRSKKPPAKRGIPE